MLLSPSETCPWNSPIMPKEYCLKKRSWVMLSLLEVPLYKTDAQQLASGSLIGCENTPTRLHLAQTFVSFDPKLDGNGRPSEANHLKLEDYVSHDCDRVRCSCLHVWLSGSERVFAYCGLPASHVALTFSHWQGVFSLLQLQQQSSHYISLLQTVKHQEDGCFSGNNKTCAHAVNALTVEIT